MPGPIFGDVSNWEELNDLIASLQVWVGKQEGIGKWIDVPYSAGSFSTDSGTWTVSVGNQLMFKYMIINDTMVVAFNFVQTTLSGVGNELRFRIPGDYAAVSQEFTGCVFAFGTTEEPAFVVTRKSTLANQLSIQRSPVAAWPDSAANQVLRGSIYFEVYRL